MSYFDSIKRVGDIVLALLALVALSPILVLIAVAVRLSSPGTIFFAQQRIGAGGKPFTMYKFRTMVADAEELKHSLVSLNEATGAAFKIKKDPRITPTGMLLRKLSLDELPQLLNVLKGDMALVGPRPALEDEILKYRQWQIRRLAVKPGITCIWQVSGRSDINFTDWMRMDLRYIDQRSFLLDLNLLFRTLWAVLKAEGAY